MKKTIYYPGAFISLALIVTLFNSCSKLKADFTFINGGCTAPCTIEFTNLSENATSYLWDFGDGNTSTEQHPSHRYEAGGNYTVTLAADGDGSASTSQTVNVGTFPWTHFKFYKVVVTQFIFTNPNGDPWDDFGEMEPDIYFNLKNATGTVTCSSGTDVQTNVGADNLPRDLDVPGVCDITDFNATFTLDFYDQDTGVDDELVGSISFVPFDLYDGASQTQFIYTLSQNNITVLIEGFWE